MTRVMVVDDHQLVRQAVSRAIDGEPDLEVVAEAAKSLPRAGRCCSSGCSTTSAR